MLFDAVWPAVWCAWQLLAAVCKNDMQGVKGLLARPGFKVSSFTPALHHCISAGQKGLLDMLLVAGGNPLLPCGGKRIISVKAARQNVEGTEKALADAEAEAATRATAAETPATTRAATAAEEAAIPILAQWRKDGWLQKTNADMLVEVRMAVTTLF